MSAEPLGKDRDVTPAGARPLYYDRRVLPGTTTYDCCQKGKQRKMCVAPTIHARSCYVIQRSQMLGLLVTSLNQNRVQ